MRLIHTRPLCGLFVASKQNKKHFLEPFFSVELSSNICFGFDRKKQINYLIRPLDYNFKFLVVVVVVI